MFHQRLKMTGNYHRRCRLCCPRLIFHLRSITAFWTCTLAISDTQAIRRMKSTNSVMMLKFVPKLSDELGGQNTKTRNSMKSTTCELKTSLSVAFFVHWYLRADFVDDEFIQELIVWDHPHVTDSKTFQYTENENMTMLRLPRKECSSMFSFSSTSPTCPLTQCLG